eukprot:UN3239
MVGTAYHAECSGATNSQLSFSMAARFTASKEEKPVTPPRADSVRRRRRRPPHVSDSHVEEERDGVAVHELTTNTVSKAGQPPQNDDTHGE